MKNSRASFTPSSLRSSGPSAFTLIELLIVIAIVTILAVVVVLTLNPAQLLRQARDSTRLSDLDTINRAISLYQVDVSNGSTGSVNTVYVSLPDSSLTCGNSGLPPLPSGWAYRCATSANYKRVDGNGWIPVNFTQLSSGSPLGALPVDPVNSTSTGNHYYTYVTGASWALASTLESTKYIKQSALADGGTNPARYETGSTLTLLAQAEGLKGWWSFEEGSGTTAADGSGNGHTATYQGSPVFGESGKVGKTIRFDGIDNMANFPAGVPAGLQIGGPITLEAWIKTTKSDNWDAGIVTYGGIGPNADMVLHFSTLYFYLRKNCCSNDLTFSTADLYNGSWHHVAVTWDGTTNANGMKEYMDGVQRSQRMSATAAAGTFPAFQIGNASTYFDGWIDEARVYNRALAASEISAIYDATK